MPLAAHTVHTHLLLHVAVKRLPFQAVCLAKKGASIESCLAMYYSTSGVVRRAPVSWLPANAGSEMN